MSRIKVLQVVTRLVVRGVPRHVIELAAGLDAERFQVDIIAGRGEPGEGGLWEEAKARGIHATYLPTLQRAVNPMADLRALASLYRVVRQGEYDIVHTHISKAGVLGRLAGRLAGARGIVHTFHGQVEEVGKLGLSGEVYRLAERATARITDRILAISRDTQRQCLSHGIGRVDQYSVVHNAISLNAFSDWHGARPFQAHAGAMVLGVVGSLTAEKGVDVLLQAVQELTRRGSAVCLFVVGDGPLRPALEEQARQLGVAESTRFTGLITDVRPWLGHFDVLVTPSVREGFPTVLLEAMAMGCPTVASCVGGIPEIIEDGVSGLLVAPGDAGQLGDAVQSLISDPDLRGRLGQAGRRKALGSFSMDDMLKQTAQVYEDLLSDREKAG